MTDVPSYPGGPIEALDTQAGSVRTFCPACGKPAQADDACPCVQSVVIPAPSMKSTFGSLRLAAMLYAAYFVVILGLQVACLIAGDDITPEFEVRAELVTDVLFVIVSLIALWHVRRDVGPMLRPPRERRWLAYGAGLALVTYVTGSLLGSVWTAIFGLDDVPVYTEAFMAADLPMGVAIALCFVSVAVFPAVSEEIGFRGVIASALGRTLDRRDATLVTALLFASIHINPFMFVNLFLMGLVFAFLVARSGSLLPAMVLHFCHNSLCVLHELVPEIPG